MQGSLGINISYVFFRILLDDPLLICLLMILCVTKIFNSDQPEMANERGGHWYINCRMVWARLGIHKYCEHCNRIGSSGCHPKNKNDIFLIAVSSPENHFCLQP